MESTKGRFAGETIEDAAEPTGSHVGEVIANPENTTPKNDPTPEKPTANKAASQPTPKNPVFTYEEENKPTPATQPSAKTTEQPPRQKGPTAVGIPPQTENLFAQETLADNPIAKKSETRKVTIAKRNKPSPETPKTVFDDPDAQMEPTYTTTPEKPTEARKHGEETRNERAKDSIQRVTRYLVNLVIGLGVGTLFAAYVIALFGPWQLTNLGLNPRNLDSPINNLPIGTTVTMAKVGDLKPTGLGRLIPVTLQASTAEILAPVTNDKSDTIGYTVKCIAGTCPAGVIHDISYNAILGKG